MNTINTEVKRPNLFNNKPTIPRPEFDMTLPKEQLKRESRIRGSTGSRCFFCGALMGLNDKQCSACGSTVISPDAIMDNNDVRKRMKFLRITNGYTGA